MPRNHDMEELVTYSNDAGNVFLISFKLQAIMGWGDKYVHCKIYFPFPPESSHTENIFIVLNNDSLPSRHLPAQS